MASVHDRTLELSGLNGIKVFSATKMMDRDRLGDRVTDWIREYPIDIVDIVITQSSDAEFHCLAITVLYKDRPRG